MSWIHLQTEDSKRSGTWVRQFGAHQDAGYEVSLNSISAHVQLLAQNLTFQVDRADIPAAWGTPIDTVQLRIELIAAICQRLSPKSVEELLSEILRQRNSARHDGVREAQLAIQKAMGL